MNQNGLRTIPTDPALQTTALLHVDPYNDFISEGGKLWERCSQTIEGVELHP